MQALRGRESSAKAKWQDQGWEFVSENRGTLRTELNFRRVKPKTFGAHLLSFVATFRRLQPKTQLVLVASCALILVAGIIGIVVGTQSGGDTPNPSAAQTTASTAPPAEPTVTGIAVDELLDDAEPSETSKPYQERRAKARAPARSREGSRTSPCGATRTGPSAENVNAAALTDAYSSIAMRGGCRCGTTGARHRGLRGQLGPRSRWGRSCLRELVRPDAVPLRGAEVERRTELEAEVAAICRRARGSARNGTRRCRTARSSYRGDGCSRVRCVLAAIGGRPRSLAVPPTAPAGWASADTARLLARVGGTRCKPDALNARGWLLFHGGRCEKVARARRSRGTSSGSAEPRLQQRCARRASGGHRRRGVSPELEQVVGGVGEPPFRACGGAAAA